MVHVEHVIDVPVPQTVEEIVQVPIVQMEERSSLFGSLVEKERLVQNPVEVTVEAG